MKILSSFFDRNKQYGPLRTVFERSAAAVMPDIPVEIRNMPMPIKIDHKRDTAWAFLDAANYVLESNEDIAVCDIDLMFTGDISKAFEHDFDIGITVREGKHPYNTGVWFSRPTQPARDFVYRWIELTELLIDTYEKNYPFIHSHGGIDQASLAMAMVEQHMAEVHQFPCVEYNAEQSCWKDMDHRTRVVHIKSGLRKYCLTGIADDKLREQWPDDMARQATYQKFRSYL